MNRPAIKKKFAETSFGNVAYLETGSPKKPPVLFVHGIPTSGYLWRDVLRFLQNDFHCYAPDLMGLGDTDVDPGSCEFHMDAQAEMLAEFMSVLGHETFGLVCHDQGGAAALILSVRQPKRVDCLVLTDCVCYDNWPVPAIALLQKLARVPLLPDLMASSGMIGWLENKTFLSNFRKGVRERDKLQASSIEEYLRPLTATPIGRERFKAFLAAGNSRYTMKIVPDLKKFEKPTLVVWAADDYYISPSWGRRLVDDIPGARRFELVPFCGHFWQEERPSEFSSQIGGFLAEHLAQKASKQETDEIKNAEKRPAPGSASRITKAPGGNAVA